MTTTTPPRDWTDLLDGENGHFAVVYRSAETGQFVSESYAKLYPGTTVKESLRDVLYEAYERGYTNAQASFDNLYYVGYNDGYRDAMEDNAT